MTQVVRVLVDGASGLEFDYSIPDKIRNKVVVGSRIRYRFVIALQQAQ